MIPPPCKVTASWRPPSAQPASLGWMCMRWGRSVVARPTTVTSISCWCHPLVRATLLGLVGGKPSRSFAWSGRLDRSVNFRGLFAGIDPRALMHEMLTEMVNNDYLLEEDTHKLQRFAPLRKAVAAEQVDPVTFLGVARLGTGQPVRRIDIKVRMICLHQLPLPWSCYSGAAATLASSLKPEAVVQVYLREHLGPAMIYFTGNTFFNRAIRYYCDKVRPPLAGYVTPFNTPPPLLATLRSHAD